MDEKRPKMFLQICFLKLYLKIFEFLRQKITKFIIASEASYVYILSRQKFIKNAKNSQFSEFLKNSNATFWVNFQPPCYAASIRIFMKIFKICQLTARYIAWCSFCFKILRMIFFPVSSSVNWELVGAFIFREIMGLSTGAQK